MPSFFDISTTFSAPTFSCSGMKYVLTDMPKPVHMLRGPFMLAAGVDRAVVLLVRAGAGVAGTGGIDR